MKSRAGEFLSMGGCFVEVVRRDDKDKVLVSVEIKGLPEFEEVSKKLIAIMEDELPERTKGEFWIRTRPWK
jgi:hypothetical protein